MIWTSNLQKKMCNICGATVSVGVRSLNWCIGKVRGMKKI